MAERVQRHRLARPPLRMKFYRTNEQGWKVSLLCSLPYRSIRIGNYKATGYRYNVTTRGILDLMLPRLLHVNSCGIRFDVPSILHPQEIITITICINDIIKVLAYFGGGEWSWSVPILFIYVSQEACAEVRRQLKMLNSRGFYLDVESLDEAQKMITILIERLTKEDKAILEQHFQSKLQELDSMNANKILVRSSSKNPQTELEARMKLRWALGNEGSSSAPPSPWLVLRDDEDKDSN